MAISLNDIRREVDLSPPRIVIHGVGGIGKTTFAAGAPSPIFICTEDGLGDIDVPHFTFGKDDDDEKTPLAKSFDDVIGALNVLIAGKHEFETVVIDSMDQLEALIWTAVCQEHKWNSIEEPGYGKGYIEAMSKWRNYLDLLDVLRHKRRMTVIQIAHTQIKRFNSPESDPYDRYIIKLQERAAGLIVDTSDIVLFANYLTIILKADVGFNKKIARGQGEGDRALYTSERPAYIAKNRYSLPHQLPLAWDSFIAAFPNGQKETE